MNEEEIQHLLKFKTQWWNELRAVQKAGKGDPYTQRVVMSTTLTMNELVYRLLTVSYQLDRCGEQEASVRSNIDHI